MDTITYLDGPMGVTEKIRKAMYAVCKEYLYIGFLLREVRDFGYYKEKEYLDVYDYAQAELGFKKSSVKNFIAISDTFCQVDKGCPTMFLKDKYEKFKYSQLCEMLSLSEVQRSKVSSDMTVRKIRELKKEFVGQTSGQIVSVNSMHLQARVSSSLSERLEHHAELSGISVDLIVEQALSQYFSRLDSEYQLNAM